MWLLSGVTFTASGYQEIEEMKILATKGKRSKGNAMDLTVDDVAMKNQVTSSPKELGLIAFISFFNKLQTASTSQVGWETTISTIWTCDHWKQVFHHCKETIELYSQEMETRFQLESNASDVRRMCTKMRP